MIFEGQNRPHEFSHGSGLDANRNAASVGADDPRLEGQRAIQFDRNLIAPLQRHIAGGLLLQLVGTVASGPAEDRAADGISQLALAGVAEQRAYACPDAAVLGFVGGRLCAHELYRGGARPRIIGRSGPIGRAEPDAEDARRFGVRGVDRRHPAIEDGPCGDAAGVVPRDLDADGVSRPGAGRAEVLKQLDLDSRAGGDLVPGRLEFDPTVRGLRQDGDEQAPREQSSQYRL